MSFPNKPNVIELPTRGRFTEDQIAEALAGYLTAAGRDAMATDRFTGDQVVSPAPVEATAFSVYAVAEAEDDLLAFLGENRRAILTLLRLRGDCTMRTVGEDFWLSQAHGSGHGFAARGEMTLHESAEGYVGWFVGVDERGVAYLE